VRYDIEPKSVRLEAGAAYLFAGSFQRDAPNGQDTDAAYAHAQVAWQF